MTQFRALLVHTITGPTAFEIPTGTNLQGLFRQHSVGVALVICREKVADMVFMFLS